MSMASDTLSVLVTRDPHWMLKYHDENPDCFRDHLTSLQAVGSRLRTSQQMYGVY